jgi:hypothetical protein
MGRRNKHPASYEHPGDTWNAGKPWSDWCLYSLLYQYEEGDNIQDIAISLQRKPDEVEAKVKELNLAR